MPIRKPRYDLKRAQEATIQIPESCVRKAMALLGFETSTAVRRHIEGLLKSLTERDFAEQAVMRPKVGGVLYGDVYGKKDEFGVWFIKFSFSDGTTTVVMSCHEAELPLKLADGRTLRPTRST